MNIIIFGAPGAGKGTQSNLLVKNFSLRKISTGDLLRKEILNNSDLGKKIKDLIENGRLVSDEIILNLIETIFLNHKKNFNFVFDGFPRTLKQANILEKKLQNYNKQVINNPNILSVHQHLIPQGDTRLHSQALHAKRFL